MFSPRRPAKPGKNSLPPRSSKSKTSRLAKGSATPIDRRQAALREKEEQLRKATEQLKNLIDDAPRRREEQTRRRREELAGDTRLSTSRTALVDKRYNASAGADMSLGHRRLRSERHDGKLFFIFLCFVLAVLTWWIWQLIGQHAGH